MSFGFGHRLPNSRALPPAGGAAAFDPNTLFAASDYGDFMCVSDSTVASSGGLLTRWPGLRSSGDGGARFDITPYASAPSVGAYGPSGEAAIRFSSGYYLVGSNDRGGASSLEIPAPYASETLNGTGFFLAARIKCSDGTGSDLSINMVDTNNADSRLNGTAVQYRNSTIPINNGAGVTISDWNTYAITRLKDGTCTAYVNGSVLYSAADSALNTVLYRWVTQILSGASSFDFAAYAFGHVELTGEQVASLSTWMEG